MKIAKGQHLVLIGGEHGQEQDHYTALQDFDTDDVTARYSREVPIRSISGHDLREFEHKDGGTFISISGERDVFFDDWLVRQGLVTPAVPAEKIEWTVGYDALHEVDVSPGIPRPTSTDRVARPSSTRSSLARMAASREVRPKNTRFPFLAP